MDLFKILYPFEWVVSWIMYLIHKGLTFIGFSDGSGPAWVISIIGLVIVIRIILIPLFFRQIKASRGMQMLQPEMQAIQKKYKGKTDPASREAMTRETMALYKKHGTNPFSSCLPILAQSPIFFALYRVLRSLQPIATGSQSPIGPLNRSVASDVESSTVFGAKLSDIFVSVDSTQAKVVIICLIVLMCATTFFTQRQLTMKNMPPSALEGPMANTQKIILYAYPLIFAVSGVNFPVGVLVYWSTTNLWSMGQQFYTIRKMPAPGSEAERRLKARQAKKASHHGDAGGTAVSVIEEAKGGQRVQPKRQSRSARKTSTGPAGASPSAVRRTEDAVTSDAVREAPPRRPAPRDEEPSVLESATAKSRKSGRSGAKGATAGTAGGVKRPAGTATGAKSAAGAKSATAGTKKTGGSSVQSADNASKADARPAGADSKPSATEGGATSENEDVSGSSGQKRPSAARPSGGSAIKKGGAKPGARKGSGGGRPQSAKKSRK